MDVQAARSGERMLRRIIAQLVASALLAERAAERSLLVRWIVLWILRRAETTAMNFVIDETGLLLAAEGFAPIGNGPDDALRLASRFRALAAALAALLPLAGQFGRRPPRRCPLFGHFAPGTRRSVVWAQAPHDTS